MKLEYFVCLVLLLLTLLVVDGTMVPQSPSHLHKRSLTEPIPSSGNQRMLVLAVQYPSQVGQFTGSQWKNDFFSLFNQFYQAQSYNALSYQIDVVTVDSAGQPVINDATSTSYIPLQHNISTYANGQYGWRFESQWNLHTIVRHASTYLDSKNFDWSPYIQNEKVLNVIVISAGTDYRYAQSSDLADAASGYLLSTSYSGVQFSTKSGAILNSYTFCSEHTQVIGSTPLVMAHLGQCVHEFGHALGIPDLYDLSSQSTGVGYFDLLGFGLYANGNPDGSTPIGYGAFPKTALGWTKPTVITEEAEVQLAASSLGPGNFLKVYPNPMNSSVYYLVENRQARDTWDKNFVNQYGTGILIWRVDEANVDKYTTANHVNTYPSASIINCPSTPAVVLVEADGVQDMSSKGFGLNFGSSKDVWQLGDQFNGPNSLSIAILGLKKEVYTIHVSYLGPVIIPDSLKASSSPPLLLSSSSPLLLILLALVMICLA